MSCLLSLLLWLSLIGEVAMVPTFNHVGGYSISLNEPVNAGTRIDNIQITASSTIEDAVLHYSIDDYKQYLPRQFGLSGYQDANAEGIFS